MGALQSPFPVSDCKESTESHRHSLLLCSKGRAKPKEGEKEHTALELDLEECHGRQRSYTGGKPG